jgi:hypothetical protein
MRPGWLGFGPAILFPAGLDCNGAIKPGQIARSPRMITFGLAGVMVSKAFVPGASYGSPQDTVFMQYPAS